MCFVLVLLCAGTPSCDLGSKDSEPSGAGQYLQGLPGLPRYERPGAIEVPGGLVNLAGGNLLLRRLDLSIDTKLGSREIFGSYNSSVSRWRWSFQMSYAAGNFVTPDGARHFAHDVPVGRRIAGGVWVRHDVDRIRSVGGLVHEFDADGRLAAIHWLSGAYPRLEYLATEIAGAPRTTEVRQCEAPGVCAPVYDVEYDAAGRVTAIEDRAGRRAEFGYDAAGRLAVARDARDLAEGWPGSRYEYTEDGRLCAFTSSEGERVLYVTGRLRGQVRMVVQAGVPGSHRFAYGKDHYVSAPAVADYFTHYRDPFGRRWTYRFDALRRLHSRTAPDGEVTRWQWEAFEVSRYVAPDGTATSWERVGEVEVRRRDPSGNEVLVRFPDEPVESRAAPFERPTERIEDDLGLIEERHYESARLRWLENGAGERTSFDWSGSDNMLERVTRPSGLATVFEDYGAHGHPGRVVFAGETETRSYDAVGNLLSRSGVALHDLRPGGEVARVYDADRNLAELVVADAPFEGATATASVLFEHGSDGRLLRIARPGGGDEEFVYDAGGRLVERRERVDGGWHATRFERDRLGRILAVELPNGMRREATWDDHGRLRSLRGLRNGVMESEASLFYRAGRLVRISDAGAGGDELYAWDAAGRLASIAFPGGERLELGWDLRGQRTSETYRLAGGSVLRTLGFGHDAAGRETRLEDDGVLLREESFVDGRVQEVTLGNGLVRRFAYDPVSGLPTASTLEHPVQGVVAATTIDLVAAAAPDAALLALETTASGPAAGTTREEYVLGPAGAGPRVTEWGDGSTVRANSYDALGNLTDSEDGQVTHIYNAERNRLLRLEDGDGVPLVEYVYDAAGYATGRGTDALAWTPQGFIAAVGSLAVFEWDALGRPRRQVIEGEERRFLFGGRVETDPAGTPIRIDLGAVVLDLAGGGHRYRHADVRGNVKLVSDDTGDVVAHYHYAPYGIADRLGDDDEAAAFAGGRTVGDLVLLGPRLLDPYAARFLAPDPVLQPLSQFTYTQGNPVWWWDPGGLQGRFSAAIAAAEAELQTANEMIFTGLAILVGGIGISFAFSPEVGMSISTIGISFAISGASQRRSASRTLEELNRLQSLPKGQSATHQPLGPTQPYLTPIPTGCSKCHPVGTPLQAGGSGSTAPNLGGHWGLGW